MSSRFVPLRDLPLLTVRHEQQLQHRGILNDARGQEIVLRLRHGDLDRLTGRKEGDRHLRAPHVVPDRIAGIDKKPHRRFFFLRRRHHILPWIWLIDRGNPIIQLPTPIHPCPRAVTFHVPRIPMNRISDDPPTREVSRCAVCEKQVAPCHALYDAKNVLHTGNRWARLQMKAFKVFGAFVEVQH